MRVGRACRVPAPLYFKRRHASSVSHKQTKWAPARVRGAWVLAWAHLLRVALAAAATPEESRQALLAVCDGITSSSDQQRWFIDIGTLAVRERLGLVSDLVLLVRQKGIDLTARLAMTWPEIDRLASAHVSKRLTQA
jgi:hypothetical protein